MKLTVYFYIAALIVLSSAVGISKTKRSLNCESLLSVKVCTKFKDAAITLKLKANAIEEAVTDAYNKGITKAQDIQTTLERFLKEQVVNKECKDFLDKSFCDKLDAAGVYLNKKASDLKPYIVKALIEGATAAKDLKNKVEDYIRNDLLTKKCEDILPQDRCSQLEDIGNSLKLKADQVKKAVVEGVVKGYTKIEDKVSSALNDMKEYAANFTCEELLNPDVCKDLRSYAQSIKIGMPKVMSAVRTAIVQGYKIGKGFLSAVYKIADAFYDCEDFLSETNCEKLKEVATKVGATMVKVSDALKSVISKGIVETEKIYQNAVDYLKGIFGKRKRSIVEKNNITDILKKYKELLLKSVDDADAYVKKAIAEILEAFKVVNSKLRETLEKASGSGSFKLEEAKRLIKDLIGKKPKAVLNKKKRDILSIKDALKAALTNATQKMRDVILALLEKPTAWLLANARDIVKLIGENVDDESLMYDGIFNEEITKAIENEVETRLNEMIDDTVKIIDDVIVEHRQRREAEVLNEDSFKVIYDIVQKYMNDEFTRFAVNSNEISDEISGRIKKAAENVANDSSSFLSVV